MTSQARNLGLLGATGVGVGAIVGGGILALAGVAFAATGPSAMLAFALNGFIAALTALSFAEMATAFPESGGTYTFAKKVLSVETAFTVGWVVWFASIVAAVLYALGFASFFLIFVERVWRTVGEVPDWLGNGWTAAFLAIAATAFYSLGLARKTSGQTQWATLGKVVVFVFLIVAGFWFLGRQTPGDVGARLRPFFANGAAGLFQAMGYSFIALQGFDLIAAVGGEVRDPARNLPRAMLFSLAIALAVYLPLLFLVATLGVQGADSITSLSAREPEAVVAVAVQNYLGPTGFWLVIVAAILSMLSALQANLYAASRVALAMARDHTLPVQLGRVHPTRGTPVAAILTSAATVIVIVLAIPNVAAAGAMSSLIFLITFALAHWTSVLARLRGGSRKKTFETPWFPLVPAVGGISCMGLALFQGASVPAAGLLAGAWVALGAALFFFLFARRARIVDASAEARDPQLVRLRGRSPLVLVPIANPASAAAMVGVATAMAPPEVGRVLLLSVVTPPEKWEPGLQPPQLAAAQAVLGQSLSASFALGLAPEALTAVARRPWKEISRVSANHRCESLLLGFRDLGEEVMGTQLEELISEVDCDSVLLRAPAGWELSQVKRVLVPVGGKGDQDQLRARLLGSICRNLESLVIYLQVLPTDSPEEEERRRLRHLKQLGAVEAPRHHEARLARSDSVADEIVRHSADCDLLILGLQRLAKRRKVFGSVARGIAGKARCAIIFISRKG